MSMVLAPDKKAQDALKKAAARRSREGVERRAPSRTAPNRPIDADERPTPPTPMPTIDIETHLGLDVTAAERDGDPPRHPGDE